MSGHRIGAAYFTSLMSIGPALLTNLWLMRVVAQNVDKAAFGVYWLVQQAVGYFAIVQIGLDLAAARTIAECLGRGDVPGAQRSHNQLVRFNRYAAAILLAVAGLTAGGFLVCSDWPAETSILAAQQFAIAGIAMAVGTLARPSAAALIGAQRLDVVNVVGVVRSIFTTILAYGLLKTGSGLVALPAAEVGGQMAAWAVLAQRRRTCCKWAAGATDDPNRGFSVLIRYGALATFGGLAWSIEAGIDVFLIKQAIPGEAGLAEVAVFALWWRFPQLAFGVISNLSNSAFPSFAATGAFPVQRRALFRKVAFVCIGLASLSIVGLGLWLPPFVRHWLGNGYEYPDGRRLAVLMALLVAMRAFGNLLGMYWLSTGRAALTTGLSWLQMAVKIVLAIWLLRLDGVCGIVIASCASISIQVAAMGWALARAGILDRSIVGQAVLLTAAPVAIAWFGGSVIAAAGTVETIVGIGLTTVGWSSMLALWIWFALRRDADARLPTLPVIAAPGS